MHWNRKSISSRLSVSILLMAIPVFILTMGILFMQSRNFIIQKATDRANTSLLTTMHRVQSHMNTIETATNINKWLVMEHLELDSLLNLSRRIMWLNQHVYGCSIALEPGLLPQYGHSLSIYSVRKGDSIQAEREREYDYTQEDWYRVPRELGKSCWIKPFNDTDNLLASAYEFIVSYCAPLYLKNGRFAGVISNDLSLHQLADAIEQAGSPYPHAYYMLIGHDGRYFIHPDSTRVLKQTIFDDTQSKDMSNMNALGKEMTAGKRGTMHLVIDNEPSIVCYSPVPDTNWSIALVCPNSEILASYHRFANIIFPLIGIGLLVILLLCRASVAHAISPIHQLLKQSKIIASGHYEIQIAHTDRIDSVGRLQNSFALMQESLDRHISSIQQAAKETERSNEELILATQMAEEASKQKTAFIQNMTHQIRTPLNIISGFAQVLRDTLSLTNGSNLSDQVLPEDEFAKITDAMRHNSRTLNRMLLMLFDSSDTGIINELNTHKSDIVKCNDMAKKCIDITYSQFHEVVIRFETNVPDDFCIQTNELYLMRSICELLYNASKYSDGKNIIVRIQQNQEKVCFIIEDVGPGIAEDYRELMFKSFTKINDLSEGLGLGLPLSKQHAVSLGGDLTYDASYGKGCRFIIELPLVHHEVQA